MNELQPGINAGIMLALASLIATHPNYQQYQLHLAYMVDSSVLEKSVPALTPSQIETALQLVASLQQIAAVTSRIDPLESLGHQGGSAGT